MRGLPFHIPLVRGGRGKPRPCAGTGKKACPAGPDAPSGRLMLGAAGAYYAAPAQAREKTRPTAPPGRERQAQSGTSAWAQMTQGMSGSGARRWSVRKHCRAGRSRKIPSGGSRTRGSGGKRTAGPRRSGCGAVVPPGASPGDSFASFSSLRKGPAPQGGPLFGSSCGRRRAGASPAPTQEPGLRAPTQTSKLSRRGGSQSRPWSLPHPGGKVARRSRDG